jgi:aminoglycoside phosphotransferase
MPATAHANKHRFMDPHHIVDRINRRHGTSYRLLSRYQRGENQGAFALQDDTGRGFVLKYLQRAGWLSRLEHAREITRRLSERGVAVPRYVLLGELDEHWTYGVLSLLPGSPAQSLSPEQAQQLVAWIELQAGQARPAEPNWSWYVRAVVFEGESGWSASLRTYSPATRALLQRADHSVAGLEASCSEAADIVHGDLALDNLLVAGGRLSGIVDWDAAGRGDRALDIAKLLYYCYDNRPVRELLRGHLLWLRGHACASVYLVYCILAQLDWSIHHHAASTVAGLVAQANVMLDDLESS